MHLGTGAITPECAAITLGAAAVGLGWGAYDAQRRPAPRKIALAAALGGFVMAAQAWNVPVFSGTSGHLVGGVLLAWALGSGLAIWTMGGVLLLQALLLGDGSLSAWGANLLNMGIVPALCVAGLRRATSSAEWEMSAPRFAFSLAGVAALSVLIAALMVCGEVTIGRTGAEIPLAAFTRQMLGLHVMIGGLEGALALPLVLLLAPVVRESRKVLPNHPQPQIAALALAAVVLVPLSLWASSQLPDGYESAAAGAGWQTLLTSSAALFSKAEAVGLCLGVVLAAAMAATLARVAALRTPRAA